MGSVIADKEDNVIFEDQYVIVCDGPDRRVMFYASGRKNQPKPKMIQDALDAGCMSWPPDEWGLRWDEVKNKH